MERITMLSAVLLAVALPALAQAPAPQPTPTPTPAPAPATDTPAVADFTTGEVSLGAEQTSVDEEGAETVSSKFFEYRDVPQGGVLPYARFQAKKGDFWFDLRASDVTQNDQSYFGSVSNGDFALSAEYAGIPHNFGFGGRSILNEVNPNDWRMSDSLQAQFQGAIVGLPAGNQIDYNCQPRFGFNPAPTCFSLSALVAPTLAAQPANVDLKIQRGRSNLALDLNPGEGPFDVGVSYFHERRSGYRAVNGTAFGFGNVVETPETVRYVTQDFGVNASYKGSWGNVRAAVHFNDFHNQYNEFVFDNPFRITDSTDPSAYQSPGSASRNGPQLGMMQLPPDNQAITESLAFTFRFGPRTRLSVDGTLGQWEQDEDPFIGWTTNTAIVIPGDGPAVSAPLFARTLGGKVDTTALNAYLTTALGPIGLHGRYRRYDFDNETPRYRMEEGYTRFDAVWEEIPRINVPYGYTNDLFDAYATFGTGALGLEAGWRHNKMEHDFRDTEEWSENVFRGAVDFRGAWASLRLIGEVGSRSHDAYHLPHSEDASFLEPGPPANQTVLRRSDQAERDLVRFGGQVELSPGKFGVFASYFHTKFEYDRGPVECLDVEMFPGQDAFCPGGEQDVLGLLDDQYDSFNAEVTFNPTDRLNLYAFYSWEDGDILQNGRQSGGTVNFSTNDVWWSNSTSKGNTLGAGVDFTLVPQKWFVSGLLRYQDIDGNNAIWLGSAAYATSIYGGNPALAQCVGNGETKPGGTTPCDITGFDDTKLTYVYGSLRYQFAKSWGARFTLGYEDYEIDDAQTENSLNYMPASFFLQANNRDYSAWVGYLTLNYSF